MLVRNCQFPFPYMDIYNKNPTGSREWQIKISSKCIRDITKKKKKNNELYSYKINLKIHMKNIQGGKKYPEYINGYSIYYLWFFKIIIHL